MNLVDIKDKLFCPVQLRPFVCDNRRVDDLRNVKWVAHHAS
jgi:hypothetical protein